MVRLAQFAGLAALAAGSDLEHKPRHLPRSSDVIEKKGERTDQAKAVSAYQSKVSHWRSNAEKKRAEMTPHEALSGLKKHLTDEEHKHLAGLLKGEDLMQMDEGEAEGSDSTATAEEAAEEAADAAADPEKKLKLSAAPKETRVEKLTRAVQTLNKMYLRIDKEKVTTETACVVDIQNMFYTDDQYWHEYDKSKNTQISLRGENTDLKTEIATAEADRDRKSTQFDQQHKDNKGLEKRKREDEYNPAQADVELFEFIANEVDAVCGKGKTFDPTKTVSTLDSKGNKWDSRAARGGCAPGDLIQNTGGWTNEDAVRQRCTQLKCAFYTWSDDPREARGGAWFCKKDNYEGADKNPRWKRWKVGRPGKAGGSLAQVDDSDSGSMGSSVSEALVNIFASDEVREKVNSMPSDKRERLQRELEQIGGDDDDAQNFLQISSEQKPADGKPHGKGKPVIGDTSQSQWSSNKGCKDCKGEVQCDDLRTIVGQELVCKRRIRDLEAAELEETEEKHKVERATNVLALQDMNGQIHALNKQVKDNDIESAAAKQSQGVTYTALKQHEADTNERLHECYEKLAELYENSYCACGALRDFMLKSAKKEYAVRPPKDYRKKGYHPRVVADCKWEPGFKPDGTPCMLGDKVIECIDPDPATSKKETDPNKLPKRTWVRKMTQRNNRHPLSMPCPELNSLDITCNNYLCPVDCEVTEQEKGKCSSDCTNNEANGQGSRQLTREIITPEKYMGQSCPELIGNEPCINNSKCPVDCRQASRHYQCAEACDAGGRSQRVRGWGRMRVWNQVKKLRTLVSAQNGGTECEPEGKGLYSKDWSRYCRKGGRRCTNSEVCTEQRDILIAFECSSGMQDGYLGSACRMTIDMVRKLIKKMYSDYMSIPMVRVGVIKFGNGKSEKDEKTGEQLIAEPEIVSDFTGGLNKLMDRLDNDDAYNNPSDPWHFGFPNYNMLFETAREMFASSDNPRNGKRKKSMIIFTKGKRADCALEMHKISKQFHAEGIEITVQLFAYGYSEEPTKYAAIRDVASYPADVHFRAAKGYSELLAGKGLVQNLIPRVCKEAKPRWRLTVGVSRWRWARYRQLHKGRTCPGWRLDIFRPHRYFRWRFRWSWYHGWKSMRACADLANRYGFRGALFTRSRNGRHYGARCLVHWRRSRWHQVNHNGSINDRTCGCIGRNGRWCSWRNRRSQIRGWAAQDVDVANARAEMAVHFRTRRDGRRYVKLDQVAGQAGKYESAYTPKAAGFL